MPLAPNDIITLNITELSHDGFGVAYLNDFPIHVAAALPGEVIQVQIIEKAHKYASAKIINIISASPKRVTPPCQYFST